MKKLCLQLQKACGFDKLTLRQSLLLSWSVFAFILMMCCNYDESAWYAMPVLGGHFGLSAFIVKRYIPKSFWERDDEGTEG